MEQENVITIKGARVNNLKNIDLVIPRDRLIVLTGLSGSGKSSLAYDTIYAEGQRRYVESLSSYARQFLGRIRKPEVDFIRGIPPAIAIEQKVNTRNPRSTVGTSTEIYDYLKLLFARIGVTFSPVSGEAVRKDSVTDVVNYLLSLPDDTGVLVMYPFSEQQKSGFAAFCETLIAQGSSRIEVNGEIRRLDEMPPAVKFKATDEVYLVVDRLRIARDDDSLARYADSVQTTFNDGDGRCAIRVLPPSADIKSFSVRFERDGILFDEPNEHMFGFNSPYGACPRCEGYGKVVGIDEELVVPDKSLSVFQDAVACWRGESMSAWKDKLVYMADKLDFPIHKPYGELSEQQRDVLWHGARGFKGIDGFFAYLDENRYKIQYRVMTARYSGKTVCPECGGGRLRKESTYVKVSGKTINELVLLPVDELYHWFQSVTLTAYEQKVAQRILTEIIHRLEYLNQVGLGYLTLNRLSSTLSGGEAQRINLSTSLGSSLVGSLYILDEPSIGLHPRDTAQLIGVLKHLQALGNTVLVVEHDEEMIRAADRIVDIGPLAGRLGGEIVFEGSPDELEKSDKSLTAAYLTGRERIEIPERRRPWNNYLQITGARANNLKNITVRFPLNVLCVVTGVSGSGKSTLVRNILHTALSRRLNNMGEERAGAFDRLTGDISRVTSVEFVDQNPIGKSSRSNPVTYSKAYDEIRKLFAEQQLARQNDLKPAHFSFNIEGGRCEECMGEGEITIEMQFMADVKLECEACHGKKFKDDVLDVTCEGKNIYDVLELTVDEAIDFFGNMKQTAGKKIEERLKPLSDVGLGYVKLGQSSSTLSGGESQRIKLASFIAQENNSHPTLFIFDEPTTGLHFHDIRKLLDAFNMLIEHGHSILVIEHNPEVIRSADWVIDLGPDGGKDGGNIVCEGTPETIAACKESYTGKYLKLFGKKTKTLSVKAQRV
ncbi:MAG: excinuclease ABC subunit UvrA [Bacteroidales bacterium]|nr:excinuclease ABC subunit UvrA [Bacteroidales bacterium]